MQRFIVIFLSLFASVCAHASVQPNESGKWKLAWSDEFETNGAPDPSKWSYVTGGDGFGNNELQYYTSKRSNSRVEGGNLVIEARKESYRGKNYTSARLVSKGKGDWTYGRLEARAMLPSGRGTWPAIWLLPTRSSYGDQYWPHNGEVDIMEHVGFDPGWVHGSIHTKKYNWMNKTQKTAKKPVPDATSAFHVYAVEWSPARIDFFIDSEKYLSFENDGSGWEAWPFNRDFHWVLNVAVGGNWGGEKGVDDSIFPQNMKIDYVRVYRREKQSPNK